MADDEAVAVAVADKPRNEGAALGGAGGGDNVVELLQEIRDLQRESVRLQVEHRQWLLLRVLLPMFAMVVILVLLAVLNTR